MVWARGASTTQARSEQRCVGVPSLPGAPPLGWASVGKLSSPLCPIVNARAQHQTGDASLPRLEASALRFHGSCL